MSDKLETSNVTEEPILCEDTFRLALLPLNTKYQILWDSYKNQLNCFWKAEEIDMSKDYDDFCTLNKDEQYFVKMVLAFFSQSDGIVNFNLRERFMKEIKVTEAQTAYTFQMMMENIHSEVYSLMLLNLIKDIRERDLLTDSIKTVSAIKKIADWAFKWIESSHSIAHRIIAFAIVEGVFFSSAFAAIFWLKKIKSDNKYFMQGLVKSNKFISRDEGLHTDYACALYSFIVNRVPKEDVHTMFDEAVKISQEFSRDAIKIEMIGMNADLMDQYVKYVADRLLVMLDYDKLYSATNPFPFMDTISLTTKDNFFETRPDAYQSAYNEKNTANWEFKILSDF